MTVFLACLPVPFCRVLIPFKGLGSWVPSIIAWMFNRKRSGDNTAILVSGLTMTVSQST